MAELLTVQCSSCGTAYALPDAYRRHLEGRAVRCADCGRWWVPVPGSPGPPGKLVDGRPQRLKLDLGKFRRRAPSSPPSSTTIRVPLTAPGRPTSLRVVVAGPDADLKGVFDLGEKSFLIGRDGCQQLGELGEHHRSAGVRSLLTEAEAGRDEVVVEIEIVQR